MDSEPTARAGSGARSLPLRTAAILIAVTLVTGLSGCIATRPAAVSTAGPAALPSADSGSQPAGASRRAWHSLSAAAHAALAEARRDDRPGRRDRLRAGLIVRRGASYVWLDPEVASSTNAARVRVEIRHDQAATYVVHPKTGNLEVDRASEGVTRAERRLVDRVDPLHRPIFVLTPSGRVLVYRWRGPVEEVADLRLRRRNDHGAREDVRGTALVDRR